MRQLLDAPSTWIDRYFLQPVSIIQALTTTSEEINEHAWSGSLAWVMSHIKVRDMMQALKRDLWQAFAILDEQGSLTYLKDIFLYILESSEVDPVEFKQVLEQHFKHETGDKLMTLAEQFRQEGRQEGLGLAEQFRQEGIQEGRQEKYSYIIESVHRMLDMSLAPAKIAQALDLSVEEVLRYQEEA